RCGRLQLADLSARGPVLAVPVHRGRRLHRACRVVAVPRDPPSAPPDHLTRRRAEPATRRCTSTYISTGTFGPVTEDPTERGRWRPLRLLEAAMDDGLARIYAEARIEGLRPSFVLELIRLDARGPMTITELAASVHRTHSATSQKVAAMRAVGWVRTSPGADARSKKVALTAKARRVVVRLAAEWRATEAAIEELEAEIPYPLSRV